MRPRKQWVLLMVCSVYLLLLFATSEALALYKPKGGFAHYRGRAYTQFAIGPAITFYTLHRELVDPVPGVDNQKKWWRFVGGARNYDLSIAYVFGNGFILGGNLSLLRSQGMDGLQPLNVLNAPDNPGEVFSVMHSVIVGFYPKPYLGLSFLFQPLFGYSSISPGGPTGGLRIVSGYEWPAGPAGAFGLNIAVEMLLSKSEEDGTRPSIKYDSVHLPLSAMLNVCFKGFWNRKSKKVSPVDKKVQASSRK